MLNGMTFKDKLLVYFLHKTQSVDNDYDDIKHQFRFHKPDEVDMLEYIVLKVRKYTIAEVFKDISAIMQGCVKNLDKSENK